MIKINTNKYQEGYIIFFSVLIVGAIATVIGISVLLLGLGVSRTSLALQQSRQANQLVNACLEEALQEINDSAPYTGTDTLILGQGTCTYVVTNEGGQNRSIVASSTVDTIVRKASVSIDAINPQINITSWQEVSDF